MLRVRIALADDDASDAGSEERVDARRRRAVMRAGLERHVHRRAARASRRRRRARRPRRAARPSARASPRRRSRRRRRRRRRRSGSDASCRDRARRARAPAPGTVAPRRWILRSSAVRSVRASCPRASRTNGATSPHGWRRCHASSPQCAEQWDLELEGPIDTPHSLVVPAGDVVLKLNAPSHFEADHEADALAAGTGRGAVRLVARDDERRAFLCERCVPGTELWDSGRRRGRRRGRAAPAPQSGPDDGHPFTIPRRRGGPLGRGGAAPVRAMPAGRSSARCVDAALDVYRTVDRSAPWLVNQDLHGGNVLRAEREPWLVIDPKPLVGERELEASGLLRNAESTASSGAGSTRSSTLGLDRERAARLGRRPRGRLGAGTASGLVGLEHEADARSARPQLQRRRRATKKPAVPWTCGNVWRNSGRRACRNCGHSSARLASTSRPEASTTASDSSALIVQTE